jgi:hypothetical protein
MLTEIEFEANELLLGASQATSTDAIKTLQCMPETSHALEKILQIHGQNPYQVVACAFLLGAYMGLSYHDIERIIK